MQSVEDAVRRESPNGGTQRDVRVEGPVENGSGFSPKKLGIKPLPRGPSKRLSKRPFLEAVFQDAPTGLSTASRTCVLIAFSTRSTSAAITTEKSRRDSSSENSAFCCENKSRVSSRNIRRIRSRVRSRLEIPAGIPQARKL